MATSVGQKRRALDERANEIGKRLLGQLSEARRMVGWSEDQLAKNIGVDTETIVRLEAGSGSVSTLILATSALKFRLAGIGLGDTFCEQLVNWRVRHGFSAEKIAAETQLSEATIEAIERGGGAIGDLFRLLALIAPGVRRRAPERAYWGSGEKADRDSRFTPVEFLEAIYAAFGSIDLDPCAHPMSPVVASRRIIPGKGGDGLTDTWSGRLAFVNPPFSAQLDWLKRAHQQWCEGNVRTVVCLVPTRTDNRFFHETLRKDADFFLLKGRLRFSSVRGDVQSTPFSPWLVALGATAEQKARFAQLVEGCWFRAHTTQAAPNQLYRRRLRRRQARTIILMRAGVAVRRAERSRVDYSERQRFRVYDVWSHPAHFFGATRG